MICGGVSRCVGIVGNRYIKMNQFYFSKYSKSVVMKDKAFETIAIGDSVMITKRVEKGE